MTDSAQPEAEAGQVWIGKARQVRGRRIRVTSVDDGRVYYDVVAATIGSYSGHWAHPARGIGERSLRASYRLLPCEER
jgi:hypothetical protein